MAPRKKKEKDEKESGDSGEPFCTLDRGTLAALTDVDDQARRLFWSI